MATTYGPLDHTGDFTFTQRKILDLSLRNASTVKSWVWLYVQALERQTKGTTTKP